MASRKVILNAFFDQFLGFVKELQQMYPEDPDFNVFQTTITMLRGTNPLLVAKFIKDNVVTPYGDKIEKCDESFFLTHSYDEHAEDVDLDIIEKLKGYVVTMSDSSKNAVWKYIQIISKLAMKSLETD